MSQPSASAAGDRTSLLAADKRNPSPNRPRPRGGGIGLQVMGRLALRDAAQVMGSRTYLGLFFAPLLLLLLLGFLVVSVTVMLVAIKVATPPDKGSPLGHDKIVVVTPAHLDGQARKQLDAALAYLQQAPHAAPEEARLFQRFVTFLRDSRPMPGRLLPSDQHSPITGGEGASSAPPDDAAAVTAPTSVVTGEALAMDVMPGADWTAVAAQIPEQYDVGLSLIPGDDGQLQYAIASDPALLFSRLMQRRVEGLIEEYNLSLGRQTPSVRVPLVIQDRVVGGPDLWLVRSLLLLAGFGIAFMYHSVGVQSVAGVLAGERDARTLDILMSLPITRRQILYGKLLGLLMTTAAPTLFWSGVVWIPAWWAFGIHLPYLPLIVLQLALLVTLMASGCAVSAASPDLMTAKNRLGMTNLITMSLGGVLFGLPSSFWPSGWHPVTLLLTVIEGGWGAWGVVLGIAVGLLAVAGAILELGLQGWAKLR